MTNANKTAILDILPRTTGLGDRIEFTTNGAMVDIVMEFADGTQNGITRTTARMPLATARAYARRLVAQYKSVGRECEWTTV